MSRLSPSKAIAGGAAVVTVAAVGLALTVPVASQATGSAKPVQVPTVPVAAQPAAMHGAHEPQPGPAPKAIPESESGNFVEGLPFASPEIVKSKDGKIEVDLVASAEPVRVAGKLLNARVFDGVFTPRVLSVAPKDNVIVNFKNNLQEPSNIHTHGMFVSPVGNSDNIFPTIEGGGGQMQYNYQLAKDVPPGTNWYHPHMHPLVEEQVFGGMSGFFYVRGLEKLLPSRFQGIKEEFLGFKDVQFDKSNTILRDNIDSNAPTTRLVNGMLKPVMTVNAGETQMWHMANQSADIWYNMTIPGVKFTVIGTDGNPVNEIDADNTVSTLMMPPARRFDVLVQFPKVGTYELKTLKMNTGPQGDTYPTTKEMTIKVVGTDTAVKKLPSGEFSEHPTDWKSSDVSAKRTMVLTENNKAGKFYVNGVQFASANDIDATPVLGATEEWTFINKAKEDHPIHIHVNDMQIMSVNGEKFKNDGMYDTVKIPHISKNGTPGKVVVLMKFRKYTGSYVFHCHILAHEDNGMMAVVNVTAKNTGPVVAGSGGNS